MITWLLSIVYGKIIACPECGKNAEEDIDGTITCTNCGYVAV